MTEPLWRWDVINALLESSAEGRYLEIGVQVGQCGSRIRAKEKWGVDPEPRTGASGRYSKFFLATSDHFFDGLDPDKLFDVVFIDGLHHADQTMRDTENALQHLAPGGTIVLHDCNPQTELAQRVPRATGVWNGDCWKTLVRLRQRSDVTAFTIDADHGLGILRKASNPRPLEDVPAELTYPDLERDRARLLGLVSSRSWSENLPDQKLGRIAVVSAVFGGRDQPARAPAHDVDEYVMFTDGPDVPGWRTERGPSGGDPRLAARRVKALALELVDADVVVWVDGRVAPTGRRLRPLLRRTLRGADIAGYPHPWRGCGYDEASECAKLGLAPAEALERQVAAYRADGFPSGAGLWNTMVLARRRTPETIAFGRAWWDEISRHTARDQISFPYLLWKHGLSCGQLGPDVYGQGSSREFIRGRHVAT